jgi:lipid-A-disaccharide synthase
MGERPLTAYVIAGEPSGDLLGAHLMRELKAKKPDIKFCGVGGPRMANQGISSLFPYHELALMGFVEILPYVFKIFARVNLVVEDILAKRPDVVITIDVPGFTLRVVEKLRAAGCKAKFVHYVAPTVWMYKPWRAALCAKLFDHMLVLLPFEPPYFTKEGLACTFVGHPVVCETKPGNGAAFREKYQISPQTKLFSLLPGSRGGEIKRHMPIFARMVALLASQYTDIAIAVIVPKHALPTIAPYFQNCPFRAVVTANDEDKKNALAASNIAITKSGTIVLEIAQAGTPMIVTHRVNALTARVLRKQMLMPMVSLINILHQKEIIPELLQEQCTPEVLAAAVSQLLSSPEQQNRQKEYCKSALAMLVPPNGKMPSLLASDTILQLL